MPVAIQTTSLTGPRIPVTLDLPDVFDFLSDPLGTWRYRVAYGGRAGAKSWSFAQAVLIHSLTQTMRVLCAREYQISIRDSVHRLLSDQIEALGLGPLFRIERARIYGVNGSEFLFHGLRHDPHKIKSLERINLCWVEEAHAISTDSWRLLTPTIRADDSEIWVTFNPDLPDDPIYETFVKHPPTNAIVRRVGWQDNPWLSQALKDERAYMLERDPEAEAHIWGGEPWSRSDAQVLAGKWRVEAFRVQPEWGPPLYGADWGFALDPTALVRMFEWDNRLWISHDERGVGWSLDETERRFRSVPGAEDHLILADNARPETINELKLRGLKIEASAKWPGSVEDGIAYLRGFEEIVIHPRCKGILKEARLYRYKTDPRTGAVLPALVDAHNHGWDAVRYALSPMIRKRPVREIKVI